MISVSMKNIIKSFGDNKVLKGVTFDTREGEIFGMLANTDTLHFSSVIHNFGQ